MEQQSPRTPRSPCSQSSPRSPPWAPKRVIVIKNGNTRITYTNNMVTKADKASIKYIN